MLQTSESSNSICIRSTTDSRETKLQHVNQSYELTTEEKKDSFLFCSKKLHQTGFREIRHYGEDEQSATITCASNINRTSTTTDGLIARFLPPSHRQPFQETNSDHKQAAERLMICSPGSPVRALATLYGAGKWRSRNRAREAGVAIPTCK